MLSISLFLRILAFLFSIGVLYGYYKKDVQLVIHYSSFFVIIAILLIM